MREQRRGPTARERSAVVRLLAEIGDRVYVPLFLDENASKFSRRYEDWSEALKFFLSGYAYERQGTSPDYAPTAVAAVDAVLRLAGGPQLPDPHLAERVW